jgi:hypothetical protein
MLALPPAPASVQLRSIVEPAILVTLWATGVDVVLVPIVVWLLTIVAAVPSGYATGLLIVGAASAGPLGLKVVQRARGLALIWGFFALLFGSTWEAATIPRLLAIAILFYLYYPGVRNNFVGT